MEVVVRTPRDAPDAALTVLFRTEPHASGPGGRPAAPAPPSPLERRIDGRLSGWLSALLRSGSFRGRANETAMLHPPAGLPVLVIGLGPAAGVEPERLRQVAALAVRRARELEARTVALHVPATRVSAEVAVCALAEGASLGAHRYGATAASAVPARVELRIDRADRSASGAAVRGVRWAAATTLARDLANQPPNELVPAVLAEHARAVGRATGARVRVLAERELAALGMGALLAVGQGSPHGPRFIVLEREPRGARTRSRDGAGGVVLVGKGVTFDTGGISLKPREGMARMKYDLSGAAAVLGVFSALPVLDPPFRVVGLLPSAENMPGGRAFKPGDVVKTLDGATVEITNTDAEGRLLLADALAYARRLSPDVVVDLATLTGAVRLALGTHAAGLFTADDTLARELLAASRASGERLWRLPLGDEYAEALRSDVADLVNSAGPDGGASIAASFLARFARGMRWAHLDIASTAWASQDRPHEPRGGTGFGARLILEWLSARRAEVGGSPKRARGGRRAASKRASAPARRAGTRATRPRA